MVTIIIKDFLLQLFIKKVKTLKFLLTYEYSNDEIKPER